MPRILIAGTGTEVGKTFVTAATAQHLRKRGLPVAARKPIQSFSPDDPQTDADVLATATGEDAHSVCPPHRWLPTPMAPPMAAQALGIPPFTIDNLATELEASLPDEPAIVLVESAGGVRSPLADDGDTRDLANRVQPALVVLVADAGLGTINAVRLCTTALDPHAVVVYLNRFDGGEDLHRRNREWLTTRDGLEIVIDPEVLATRLADRY
jgi:dethiobiotin synthetase